MHFLLATIGSHGDVHPFIGLGQRLRAHGHDVTLLTAGHFEPLARRAGLKLVDPAPELDYLQLIKDPRIWSKFQGMKFVLQNGVSRLTRPVYDAIARLHEPGNTVVVGSSLALGARIAQEKLGIPAATVHLSPSIFRSDFRNPVVPAMMLGEGVPRWFKRLQYWVVDRLAIDPLLSPTVNGLRRELGLPPVARIMSDYWHSPQLVLGLFPDWYGEPQLDWPRQVRLTGFPLYDEHDVSPPTDEVREFMEAGAPPIAFTPGSGNIHAREFFAAAAASCAQLGRRGVLLTRFPEQLPDKLPEGVRHFDFVPLGWLLPRAAAMVHHGGIGTAAQALAAGVPQLIMPLGFDQFDNADRLERFGVGRTVLPKSFRAPTVAAALNELCSRPETAAACRKLAGRLAGVDGLTAASDELLRLAAGDLLPAGENE